MTASDIADIESLTGWDTPALSNALDALRLRPHHSGYIDGSIHRITGAAPMAGRAVTARMVAREPGEDGIPVSYLHRAIAETDGPVVVVLEDCDDPAGAGAFLGEVNGSLLAALHVRGVVTNSRVRDVGELREFPYPVYAAGLCVARAYMRLIDVGTDVTVAGLTMLSRVRDLPWGGEDGGSAPGWLWGEFWIQILSSGPTADPARESLDRPRPLEPGGPVQLDRLAEVSRHPAGCVEAHGRIADQLCQVRLKVLELGGSDLPLPLIAQLVEDRFTLRAAPRSRAG